MGQYKIRKNLRTKEKRLKKNRIKKEIEALSKNIPERPKFYCTVCHMKTWTYHEHTGDVENTSVTKRKASIKKHI